MKNSACHILWEAYPPVLQLEAAVQLLGVIDRMWEGGGGGGARDPWRLIVHDVNLSADQVVQKKFNIHLLFANKYRVLQVVLRMMRFSIETVPLFPS